MSSRLFRLIVTSLVLLGVFFANPAAFEVLAAGEVMEPAVEYTFGSELTFSGRIPSLEGLKEVQVSFRPQGETNTLVGPASVDEKGSLVYTHDLTARPLRAFTTVDYWFTLSYSNGSVVTTETQSFHYIDNRFNWQSMEDEFFVAHWYDGDLAFGQSILDVAHEGLEHARNLMPLPDPERVDIYIYTSYADYNSTLQISGRGLIAGNALVDQQLMAVSLLSGPERRLDMERKIPHELMHILVYQVLGSGYERLPTWLTEGLATMAEIYPNPDYYMLMEDALQQKRVLPIASLCPPFPVDASSFALAYAEANSFTRFLYQQYGSTGLQNIVLRYADGVGCERGVEMAVGKPLTELEQEWLGQGSVAAPPPPPPDENQEPMLPWFVLLFFVLVAPLALTALVKPARKTAGPVPGDGI